jgi:hypothetical protein
MTDWDLMAEQIHAAMQAVDQAYQAKEALEAERNSETLDAFALELEHLCTKLARVKWALEHPGQFSMDEVNDALSRLMDGEPVRYRTTKPLNITPKAKDDTEE